MVCPTMWKYILNVTLIIYNVDLSAQFYDYSVLYCIVLYCICRPY